MPGLDFLDAQPGEPIDAPIEQANDGPARGADGKFTSAEPAAAPVEDPAPTPPPEAAKPEPGYVPLAALLDTRDRLKAAEERAAALENQQPAPDAPQLDPDTANAILQERLNNSEELAEDKFGKEVVAAAKAAIIARFAENPSFQQEVLAKRNPYKFAVEWHQEQQRLEAVRDPTEFEAFQAWKAAQAAGQGAPPQAQPAAAVHTPAASPTPPRSLASATNAGGAVSEVPQGPGTAFDSVIK